MLNWYDILPISQIDHRIFIGGHAGASELVANNPHKITAILNVDQHPDDPKSPEIVYMHVPFDDGYAIPRTEFIKCLGWLKAVYEAGHTIFIHCAAGISRSVTVAASFLHFMGMLDFDEALHRIKMSRPVANPAPATLLSAKKMLGVWPYDGSLDARAPEHEQTIHDAFVWMDAARLAQVHTKDTCPMKIFLLAGDPADNRARHEIPCSCSNLNAEGL
jgi:protein-tyrosine phosphatase